MENIQRELEKELAAAYLPKPSRKPKRWTLMLVGDQGKIISINRFKGVLFVWIFLLAMAIAASATLFYLYQRTNRSNIDLEATVDSLQRKVFSLRNEKDILMARLVVQESSLKLLKNKEKEWEAKQILETVPESSDPLAHKKEPVADIVPIAKKEDMQANQKPDKPQKTDKAEAQIKTDDPKKAATSIDVSVEDLKVTYEAGSKTFRAQFILRNTRTDSNPISGYTSIVLKNSEVDLDQLMTLPTVKLVSGKPVGYRKGQYFSIARFKTVRFRTTNQSDPNQYNTAVIFVFDSKKDLIFERAFPIIIEEIFSAAKE